MAKLNIEQKRAVQFGNGPVLIVAGAGTGKTTAITERIAYLIKNKKIKPEKILALTFTDKAATEMEERVDKLLPFGYHDLWISTFHSFSQRILQEHGLDIGLTTSFKILDQTASWLLVKKNLDYFNLDYYKPLGSPTKFIHALISHFSRCKDQAIYPENYLKYAQELKSNLTDLPENQESERIKEIAEAYCAYQKLLLDNSALDFGDLINYSLELFQKRPWILKKYQKQFKYILVDEFQDTNWVQYELVKLLAKPKNNLTVCADDDQSIYKFRGASVSNVLQFRKDFSKAREIALIKNYRSKQNILDLAYKFIQQNNPNRLEYLDKINKKLKAQIKGKAEIKHLHFKNSDQEVNGVINKIIELLKKTAGFNDFAILVRANDSANAFCRALERANLPYQFLASRGLYSKPIILDIIAYFKLLDNYHESPALYRILSMPCFKFSYQDIIKITQNAYRRTKSIYESLSDLHPNHNLLNLIRKHTKLAQEKNISEIFVKFLQDSGCLEYLSKKQQMQDLDYISQFYEKIKQFEENSLSAKLKDFLEELNLELESGEQGKLQFDPEQGPEIIKIMTIHSAKGLEFKYVFLVNLVDKKFPTIERREPIEVPKELIKDIIPKGNAHLEEERRLFYVGLTRAKAGLFLTSAEDYGGMRSKKMSRFLIELGFRPNLLSVGAQNFVPLQKQTKPAKLVLPNYFSFTQLKSFENCPLQYKFAHILKIPIKGRAVFSFGKTMHDALFEFVSRTLNKKQDLFGAAKKQDISLKELLEIYEQKWIDDWYEDKKQKQDYYKLGKKSLKAFYQDFCKNKPDVLFLEKNFRLKIAGETLIGRIDRIDKTELIDYKTGRPKEKLEPEDKEQLLIYQIAIQDVFGLKPKKISYYYLEGSKKLSFLGSEQDLEKQKNKIISQIQKIKKSDFQATPGWQCKFCDFKEICEWAGK
ncbi:MAG: ATP-dependent DNA helicase [bacterium]